MDNLTVVMICLKNFKRVLFGSKKLKENLINNNKVQ